MREKVKDFMEQYHMVTAGDRVLLGLSGGADSVCLFHLLRELQEPLGISLLAVHVNHNLRGTEAERDAAFAEDLCRTYAVPFYLYSCPVEEIAKKEHLSTEEAGRAARQEVFASCAREHGAAKIALAHHQDDVAETMLHHLARGTSLTGLAALRPVRGNVIRPLLCVGRKEIRQELESRQLSWCEDSTNGEDSYTRNGIRHHVLPYLTDEVNPRAAAHMAQASLDLMETEEYLEQQTQQLMERYASTEEGAIVLRDAVCGEAPLLQRYAIRHALEQLAGKRKDLTREHLESVRKLFGKQVGKRICLPYGITAVRGYETLRLEKQGTYPQKEEKAKNEKEVSISVPAMENEEKSLVFAGKAVTIVKKTPVFPERIEEKKYTKCFDCDKIKDGLVLRTRRSGDYLRVTAKGGKKKLKDYMIDAKIPREERDSILLLADGSEIWWVVGYRAGESGRVREDTKAILQIQLGISKEES
ncbi:tRNA lysidine(34) synthetase TilS [Fusicatenibacter sp.]